jgi:multidrug efflux pump subunit AcrA (membrane-fusion protein)
MKLGRTIAHASLVILLVLLLVLGLYGASCTFLTPQASTPAPTFSVPTAAPASVTVAGVVAPCKRADLSFNTSGRILKILVTAGQTVEAGQALAILDAPAAKHALSGAEADVMRAEAELVAAKARAGAEQIAAAEANAATARSGVKVAEAAVDIAQTQLTVVQASLERAQEAVEIARAEAQRLKDAGAAKASLDRANAALEQSEGQLRSAEATVAVNNAQLTQAQARLEVARAQADQAQAELDLIRANSGPEKNAIAESEVAAARARLAEARDNVAALTIVAPFDGIVGGVLIDEAEAVSAQQPVVRIGESHRLCIETEDLRETDISRVKPGQNAVVRIGALPGRTYAARVVSVAPMAVVRQSDRVYPAVLELAPDADGVIRWGMNASIQIRTE